MDFQGLGLDTNFLERRCCSKEQHKFLKHLRLEKPYRYNWKWNINNATIHTNKTKNERAWIPTWDIIYLLYLQQLTIYNTSSPRSSNEKNHNDAIQKNKNWGAWTPTWDLRNCPQGLSWTEITKKFRGLDVFLRFVISGEGCIFIYVNMFIYLYILICLYIYIYINMNILIC